MLNEEASEHDFCMHLFHSSDFARNYFLSTPDDTLNFILYWIIWQNCQHIGHLNSIQGSLTEHRSQNLVNTHSGQSQVMRGIKLPSLSNSCCSVSLISKTSGLGCLDFPKGIFFIVAMDYVQSTVELHLAENMIGRLFNLLQIILAHMPRCWIIFKAS